MPKKDYIDRVNQLIEFMDSPEKYEELDTIIHGLTIEIRVAIETLEKTQEWLMHLAMAAQKRNLMRMKHLVQ